MDAYKNMTMSELKNLITSIEKDNAHFEIKIIKNQEYLDTLKQELRTMIERP